jgi:hypothetical protein
LEAISQKIKLQLFNLVLVSLLSFLSPISFAASLCSAIPVLSENTFKVIDDRHLNKLQFDINAKNINPNVEKAFQELTQLDPQEREALTKDLLLFADDHFGEFTVNDFLLLGSYYKFSWSKLFQNEIRVDHFFNSSVWWTRGYLFSRMPQELNVQVREILLQILSLYRNTPLGKKANRVLSFLHQYLDRPEMAFQSNLEKRLPLQNLFEDYFTSEAKQPSHYSSSNPISAQEFGKLVYRFNELLNNDSMQQAPSVVYWFGSVPNGRGKLESDFDLAADLAFDADQIKHLQKTFNNKQDYSVQGIKHTIASLLFLSPLSITFNKGHIFLVVRELISNEQPVHFYNSNLTVLETPQLRMWHYPVKVTSEGKWSYDESVPVWIE